MVNPLRGFVSQNHRLFEEIDRESKGITIYEEDGVRAFLSKMLDTARGRTESITIGGDTVTINKKSAEDFFRRNGDALQGLIDDQMPFQEKIFRILSFMKENQASHLTGLPLGLFTESLSGGEEGRKVVMGMVHQFESVLDVLQSNNFEISSIRAEIHSRGEKFLRFDREVLFKRIISENTDRVDQLESSSGRPELQKFARLLIYQMKQKPMNQKSE